MKEEAKNALARERSMKRTKMAMWICIALAGLISIFFYIRSLPPPIGKYDDFAKCIANTSTTFYGAYWCPHCQDQKRLFGSAAQYLPYVECSLPNQAGETQECIDKGVTGYPTWHFPDGSAQSGLVELDALSTKTGCSLPTSTAQ